MSENVIVAEGKYQPHPDSYSPRVFVYVKSTDIHYELLRTGEAIPWPVRVPEGFDFWICDVTHLADLGVHRAQGIEPHVTTPQITEG
jgi:hypothetical protein